MLVQGKDDSQSALSTKLAFLFMGFSAFPIGRAISMCMITTFCHLCLDQGANPDKTKHFGKSEAVAFLVLLLLAITALVVSPKLVVQTGNAIDDSAANSCANFGLFALGAVVGAVVTAVLSCCRPNISPSSD